MIPQFQQLTQIMQRGHAIMHAPEAEAGNFDAAMGETNGEVDPQIEDDLQIEGYFQIDSGVALQTLLVVDPTQPSLTSAKDVVAIEEDEGQIETEVSAQAAISAEMAAPIDVAIAIMAPNLIAENARPLPSNPAEFQPIPLDKQIKDTMPAVKGLPKKEDVAISERHISDQLAVKTILAVSPSAAMSTVAPQVELAATGIASKQSDLEAEGIAAEITNASAGILPPIATTQRATTAELAWHLRMDGAQPQLVVPPNPLENAGDTELSAVSLLPNRGEDSQRMGRVLSKQGDTLAAPFTPHKVIDERPSAEVSPLSHPIELKEIPKKSAQKTILQPLVGMGNTDEQKNSLVTQVMPQGELLASGSKPITDSSTTKLLPLHKSDAEAVFAMPMDRETSNSIINSLTEGVANFNVQNLVHRAEKVQVPQPVDQFVPTVFKQLLPHSNAAKAGGVELSLSPAELGHVKFQIHQQSDSLRVVLSAERSDTLDLLRRNAEQLLQEFKQAGFSDASLSFGQWDQQGKTAQMPAQGIAVFDEDFAAEPTNTVPRRIISKPLPSGQSLDLRL